MTLGGKTRTVGGLPIHCRTCGCVTHWEPLQPQAGCKHGVNLGNFDPALIASVRVRRFDGADSWTFLEE